MVRNQDLKYLTIIPYLLAPLLPHLAHQFNLSVGNLLEVAAGGKGINCAKDKCRVRFKIQECFFNQHQSALLPHAQELRVGLTRLARCTACNGKAVCELAKPAVVVWQKSCDGWQRGTERCGTPDNESCPFMRISQETSAALIAQKTTRRLLRFN